MSEQDEQPMFTLEEREFLQRVVDNELGDLQDNRRRQELSERRNAEPNWREQLAQAIADKLAGHPQGIASAETTPLTRAGMSEGQGMSEQDEQSIQIALTRDDARKLFTALTAYLFAGQRTLGPSPKQEAMVSGLRDEIDKQLGEGWWDESPDETRRD